MFETSALEPRICIINSVDKNESSSIFIMFMKGIYLHHITVFSGTEITIALGE